MGEVFRSNRGTSPKASVSFTCKEPSSITRFRGEGNRAVPAKRVRSILLRWPIFAIILLLVLTQLQVYGQAAQGLPKVAWWMWIYDERADSLLLFNEHGQQATLARPKLPFEALAPENTPQMSVSPDGQVLVVSARLQNGNAGLGFYHLATGYFLAIHEALPGEAILLDSAAYNVDSSQIAIGLAGPGVNAWRVIVFSVAYGSWLYRTDNTAPLITDLRLYNAERIVRPKIVYFGQDEVHVQLIGEVQGAGREFPTFAWKPEANSAAPSPYFHAAIDVLPSTMQAVYLTTDPAQPEPPVSEFNALASTLPPDEPLWAEPGQLITEARWAADGELILFQTYSASEAGYIWRVLTVDTRAVTPLPSDIQQVIAAPGGFISMAEGGRFSFHAANNPTSAETIWSAEHPSVRIVYTSRSEVDFALTRLAPSPQAIVIANGVEVRGFPGVGGQTIASGGPYAPLQITGRTADNTWLEVQFWLEGMVGWAAAEGLYITIDLASVPIRNAPVIDNPVPLAATVASPTALSPDLATYTPVPSPTFANLLIDVFEMDAERLEFPGAYSLPPCSCTTLHWAVSTPAIIYLTRQEGSTSTLFGPLEQTGSAEVCAYPGGSFYTLYAGGFPGQVPGVSLSVASTDLVEGWQQCLTPLHQTPSD